MSVRAGVGGGGGAPGTFLTLEETGLVEMADIGMHEKFLCRLTVNLHSAQSCSAAVHHSNRACSSDSTAPSIIALFFGTRSEKVKATKTTSPFC